MPARLIVSEYLSLDGVMENPSWTAPYWTAEVAAFKRDELFATDALLLGRLTYQGFAAAWPDMTDEDGFADRMNRLPKHIASTTLTQVDLDNEGWNGHLLDSDLAAAVSRLKQRGERDLLVFGSGVLVRSLLAADLVDEYRLLVFPVLVGSGKRLFEDQQTALQLADTRTFDSGISALTYRPTPQTGS